LCLDGLSRNRFWGNTTTHRNKSLKVQQVTRLTDTIFALATPPGKSAVQIIRISGAGAARALKAMIGHVPPPRQAHFAVLSDANGDVLDQALVLYFQAPASATGEDTVELHLHGSPVLGRMVMERLETLPRFRLADPGEFSRRAFLNGKINLDQAEGIADIIDANTITQHQQAIRQLDGVLSRKTDDWRQMIISISAELAALIDFADEDLPLDMAEQMIQQLTGLQAELDAAIASAHRGMIRRDGVKIALIGKPNAGKSTLLNHLVGDDRAIVSDEAGTTRDLVDVAMDIDGVFVTITDTAGLRDTAGAVEAEGMRRARQAAASSEIILVLVEALESDPVSAYRDLVSSLSFPDDHSQSPRILPVLTKIDQSAPNHVLPEWLMISVHQGAGLAVLDEKISALIADLLPKDEAPILTRQRHLTQVKIAAEALNDAAAHHPNEAPELMAEDLRRAATALGRISGHVDVEDLLDHIFSRFCIGK